MTDDNNKELLSAIEVLNARIEKQNTLLTAYLKSQTSVRLRIVTGLWTGLGTVLGATVVVSGIVLLLKPLAKIDWISPIVDKVISSLEHRTDDSKQRRNDQSARSMYNRDDSSF